MINNIIKFVILILIICFFLLIFNHYFSEKNVEIVENNRSNLETKVFQSITELPVLPNDISDSIEFNSGFENSNKSNFKRNFWELFK
tara:strand:- start:242 stop:502 length:261 start_codon:yes stop_codon:yes gene_type:complete